MRMNRRRRSFLRLKFEELEDRRLLTVTTSAPVPVAAPYWPASVLAAYGVNQIPAVNGTPINGAGQTIAIMAADTTKSATQLLADLHAFDTNANVNLPDPPSVSVVAAPNPNKYPYFDDPNADEEEDMDIEWAHAMAPGANLVVVVAPDPQSQDGRSFFAVFDAAANYAASLPGVSVVSMSYGYGPNRFNPPVGPFSLGPGEYPTETNDDPNFVTPAGHQGVTYVISAGDTSIGSYPAMSPNVVAVGGTTLTINQITSTDSSTKPATITTSYSYNNEIYWNAPNGGTIVSGPGSLGQGGEGLSAYESEPAYQQGFQSTGARSMPDVSLDADYDNTPVQLYFSDPPNGRAGAFQPFGNGGTSLAAPLFAGLMADVNQERVLLGGTTLDGPSQTLPALYQMANNGDYNQMATSVFISGTTIPTTGLGSPKANVFVPDLASYGMSDQFVIPTPQTQTITFTEGLFGVANASGTFNLTVAGVTVAVVCPSVPNQTTMSAAIQTALNNAPAPLGPGTTLVSANLNPAQINITFTGSLAYHTVPPITFSTGTLSGNSLLGYGEVQTISFTNALTTSATGSFNLTVEGVTVSVPYPSTASAMAMVMAIQNVLDKASAPLGAGTTLVALGSTSATINITFVAPASPLIAPITYSNGTLIGNGISGPPLVAGQTQTLTFANALSTAATGAFKLTVDGVSVPVAYPAIANQANMVAAIQAALDAAVTPLGPGTTVVTAGPDLSSVKITYIGSLTSPLVPPISYSNGTLSGNGLSGPPQIAGTTGQTQTVTFANALSTAASGTFNLTVDGVTVPVAYPAIANQANMVAAIQVALETAAAPLGPAATVVSAGTNLSSVNITLIGLLVNTIVPPLSFDNGTLAGNAIITEPTITAGTASQFTVEAQGAGGGVDPTVNGAVFVNGNNVGTMVAGIAKITLTLTQASSALSVPFSVGSVSAPVTFNVLAGAPAQLRITSEPPSSVNVNEAFGVTVTAVDAFGNLVTNYTGSAAVALLSNPTQATLGGTLTQSFVGGVAAFGGLTIGAKGSGYTLVLSTQKASVATTPISTFNVLQLIGKTNNNVSIAFPDSTHFTVTINGNTTQYDLSQYNGVRYQGPTGKFSQVVFDDPTRAYAANQSLTSTQMVSSTFSFEADNVQDLFVYTDTSSTAAVTVGQGTGANYYVDDADGGYSYIADPLNGIFSQLIGFGPETVTGSGGSTYAYIYSTSQASIVGDPAGSSVTVGGVKSTLGAFSQLYVLGASDGSDQITLNAQGGGFVGTPTFSYVSGTYQNANFIIGAIYAANVTAQASTTGTDTAFFESYANNAFNGSPSSSSLSGSALNAANSSYSFTTSAVGFLSVAVLESGGGTDYASLRSTGGGVFVSTSTADTLTVGSVTITVDTFVATTSGSGTVLVAAASQVIVTGQGNGSDSAFLYDSPGTNALVAGGNSATLTTADGTVVVNDFAAVTAVRQNGSNDTLHEDALDFVLATSGVWTRV